MSLNARFAANFDAFKTAVHDAETTLQVFERGTKKAAYELTRLEESYSGQRVVKEAVLAAEAIDRIGGASKLTHRELTLVAAVADEATEKLTRIGQAVPDSLARLNQQLQNYRREIGGSTAGATQFHEGLKQVDRTLTSAGLPIARHVSMVGELAAAYSRLSIGLGVIPSLGFAAASALGGWQLGRWTAEFFNFDQTIARTAATLLGFGDVIQEEAAAKIELLGRASALAGREITNIGIAAKIVERDTKEGMAAAAEAAEHAAARIAAAAKEQEAFLAKADRAIQAEIAREFARLDEESQSLTNSRGVIEIGPVFGEAFGRIKELEGIGPLLAEWATGTRDLTSAKEDLTAATERLVEAFAKEGLTAGKAADATGRYVGVLQAIEEQTKSLMQLWGVNPTPDTGDPIDAALERSRQNIEQYRALFAQKRLFDDKGTPLTDEGLMALEAAEIARASAEVLTLQAGLGKVTDETRKAVQVARELADAYRSATPASASAAPQPSLVLQQGRGLSGVTPAAAFFRQPGFFADGGIATRPTAGVFGEAGPEALIPLDRVRDLFSGGGTTVVHLTMTGVLLSSDPGGKKQLKDAVQGAVFEAVKRGKRM